MATFTYTAVSKEGRKETATLEAANALAAGHLLKEQGLMPLEISERSEGGLSKIFSMFGGVPLKEKIVFIEDLSLMIKSGIAAPRALKILAKQTKNKKFKAVLIEIAGNVEAGKSLHEALEGFPKVFSHIFVSMVKVGELSGNLEKALEYLSVQLEREQDLKRKTKGAMIYPAVIVSAMVIIGVLMAIFVLPKLTSTFKEFGGDLPIMTKMVIAISDFAQYHSFILVGAVVAVIVGIVALLKTTAGQRAFDAFLLRFPMINPIVKKINLARFARVLSSMLKSGIAIVEGLKVSGESMGNAYYREAIAATAESVKVGKPLTEAFTKEERLFPYIVVQMLEVGEETGNLEDILEQLAVHYETEVDETMRNLSSIIEPLLLLVIGGVVGVLALALIAPIYNISQSIQ
jgi:type IV pilus assembly protein PilC